jgi:hypothetical protein
MSMQAFCGRRRNRQFVAKTPRPWSFEKRWSAGWQVAREGHKENVGHRFRHEGGKLKMG